jgi:predicted amidophosphoribosyltransferase
MGRTRSQAPAAASIFLPAGCRLCEELLTRASRLPICGDCLGSFSRIGGCVGQVCGRPLDPIAATEAQDHFDRARSFARYEEAPVRAIVLLKSEETDPLADWFARRQAEVVRFYGKALQADVVVPVPLHKIRRRERGFNQAELLPKRPAKRMALPHQGVLLVRETAKAG